LAFLFRVIITMYGTMNLNLEVSREASLPAEVLPEIYC